MMSIDSVREQVPFTGLSKSVRHLTALLILVAIAVMGTMLVFLFQANQRSAALDELESTRAYCDTAISEFSNASDYLTSQVRQFAADGGIEHARAFWNEVDTAQTRDKAVQKLLHSNLTDQEVTRVMRAKAYSDSLVTNETWAMRMIAEGYGIAEADLPSEIKGYSLAASDEALVPAEKVARAQSYLYGTAYEGAKQEIKDSVAEFRSDISTRLEESASASLSAGNFANAVGLIATILLMSLLIITVVAYSRVMNRKNRELTQALQRAQVANEAKSYFTSHMSHEIRTPLNAVLGYMDIAEQTDDPAVQAESLDKSHLAAKNLLNIVNDVLDLSAIENGRMKLSHECFSLSALLSDTRIVYAAQAQNKGVDLSFVEEGVEHDIFVGDAMRIGQMLANLLSNAIKFTPSGGSVVLTVSRRKIAQQEEGKGAAEKKDVGTRVELTFSVRDTGIGMSPEFLPHVFEPYEQADSSISRQYGGTGLGLSIVKSMAEMMGGSIAVESVQGEGTIFTVILPIDAASTQDAQAFKARMDAVASTVTENAVEAPLEGMVILLAEDNPMNAEIAVTVLKRHGAQKVVVADDGRAAVDAFEQATPGTYDLILMDIQMPKLDGLQAAKRIRASNRPDAKAIPIIAMTANAFDEDVRKARDAGMNGHIAKPLDVAKMLAAIDACRR